MSAIDPQAFEPEGDEYQDREHFRIDGKQTADWALRKLAKLRASIEENKALYDQEQERLEAWLEDANTPHLRDQDYFEAILRNWHQEQLAEDPKAKTIKLPGGKLQARQNPDKLEVTDEDAFLSWAESIHPDWVRTKKEPIKSDIKNAASVHNGQLYDADGVHVPGVALVEGEVTWKAVTE